jgi:hypothetical protein
VSNMFKGKTALRHSLLSESSMLFVVIAFWTRVVEFLRLKNKYLRSHPTETHAYRNTINTVKLLSKYSNRGLVWKPNYGDLGRGNSTYE